MDVVTAINKLLISVNKINARKYVSQREEASMKKAIVLYFEPDQPTGLGQNKTGKRRMNYQVFLKELSDIQLVAACAVGFGQTIIGDMGDDLRLSLPSKINERGNDFRSDILLRATDKYRNEARQMQVAPAPPIDENSHHSEALLLRSQCDAVEPGMGANLSPAGELFPLSREAIIQMVMSTHFQGAYHLSEPYDTGLTPIVQISVSHEWSHWIRSNHNAGHP